MSGNCCQNGPCGAKFICASCDFCCAPTLARRDNIVYAPISKCGKLPTITSMPVFNLRQTLKQTFTMLNIPNTSPQLIVDTLLSTVSTDPTNVLSVHFCQNVNHKHFDNAIQYVKINKQLTKKSKLTWPVLNMIQDLNAFTSNAGIVTASTTLIILSPFLVIDAHTGKMVQVNDIFPEIQVNGTGILSINNITIGLGTSCPGTAIPVSIQVFLFRTNNISQAVFGDYTIGLALLTDFRGVTTFYAVIIDNTDGSILFELGQPSYQLSFLTYCNCLGDKGSILMTYQLALFSINLNLAMDVFQSSPLP